MSGWSSVGSYWLFRGGGALCLLSLVACARPTTVAIETTRPDTKPPPAPVLRARDTAEGRGIYGRYGYDPRLLEARCKGGDPSACNDLGYLIEAAARSPRDAQLAAHYYQEACAQSAWAGCNNLGLLLRSTRYGAVDPARGLKLLQLACDGDEPLACRNLAWLFLTRNSSALSRSEGMRLLTESCESGLATACGDLGLLSVRGLGVPRDERYGAMRLQAACSQGSVKSCADLGLLLLTAATLERDPARAAPLFEYACQGGSMPACSALGVLLAQSDDKQAVLRGHALMRRACDAAMGTTCNDWGLAHAEGWGMPRDMRQAALLFHRACGAHEVSGCASYAELMQTGEGGVPVDPRGALELFSKACTQGSFRACHGVGLALLEGRGIAKQAAETAPYLQYACEYKFAPACDALAGLLDSGQAGTNLAEAVRLSAFSCEQGIATSCLRLGDYYERGVGVGRDRERAGELRQRACRLGSSSACALLSVPAAEQNDL